MFLLTLSLILTGLFVILLRPRPLAGLYLLIALLPLERIGSFDLTLGETSLTVRLSQLVGLSLLIVLATRREWFRLRRFARR